MLSLLSRVVVFVSALDLDRCCLCCLVILVLPFLLLSFVEYCFMSFFICHWHFLFSVCVSLFLSFVLVVFCLFLLLLSFVCCCILSLYFVDCCYCSFSFCLSLCPLFFLSFAAFCYCLLRIFFCCCICSGSPRIPPLDPPATTDEKTKTIGTHVFSVLPGFATLFSLFFLWVRAIIWLSEMPCLNCCRGF